ncbi:MULTISPECIES: hydrogenase formation protein HypD [Anaerolinea]|uniref:hydrogenase formation protein HypD n=1 Tax=Anaerolinea TaxID=233189 RepID=UPI00260CBA8F|nr:hydrogenase formation protein HypD [Anaerolinea thermophila]
MSDINLPFRDHHLIQGIVRQIQRTVSKPWVLMEICGGQTHAILRYGIDQVLPPEIELVHGPGCPVCVTPLEQIDKALAIASQKDVIFTSFGDMLRVPGSSDDLFSIRARGGDVRVVYSPIDAVQIARENPDKQVVFFAIGFETTAPANAAAILQAQAQNLGNFSLLVSQVRVPPAMHTILSSPSNRVQGFLAAGHVCTVMGYWEYEPIAEKYQVPIVVTGFEPADILLGILKTVELLENGKAEVYNAYPRAVQREGNQPAQRMIDQVFMPVDRNWRGIGLIPLSGWGLREAYKKFDAEHRFQVGHIQTHESPLCIAGEILQGVKKPHQCSAFGTQCTPEHPLGAPMVSAEGACSAFYRYSRIIRS